MARPDHISEDVWARAAEAHSRFADSRMTENLQVVIADAIAAERQRCAMVCDRVAERKRRVSPRSNLYTGGALAAEECAETIRTPSA